jgi:hypothetical protein
MFLPGGPGCALGAPSSPRKPAESPRSSRAQLHSADAGRLDAGKSFSDTVHLSQDDCMAKRCVDTVMMLH